MASPLFQLPSATKAFAFRGHLHQDIKLLIQEFAARHHIKAGAILTAVGSLERLNIRYANQTEGDCRTGFYEIMSLTGTVSDESCHLHLAVADGNGKLTGGHLLPGNLIYTTAKIVLVDLIDLAFRREKDTTYHFNELVVNAKR